MRRINWGTAALAALGVVTVVLLVLAIQKQTRCRTPPRRPRPQLVVATGGRAGSGQHPSAVSDASERMYQDLKSRLPQAKVS